MQQYQRHYNPSETRPHHYGKGATQRIYQFENGHPTVSVIPIWATDCGEPILDRFEVASFEPSGTKILAYYITEEELQVLLDACAGAVNHASS